MKLTTNQIKKIIKEEIENLYLNEMKLGSGFEALIAGPLMATSLVLLAHEIVVKQNPNSEYNQIKRAFQDPELSMQISEMDFSEIEKILDDYPRSGNLSQENPRRTISLSDGERMRIATEISNMSSDEIYEILQDDTNLRAAFKDLMRPEDELQIQKDNTLYREFKKKKKYT